MATYLDHKVRGTAQTTDGATAQTCGSYTLADETIALGVARVVGVQQGSTNVAAYIINFAVKRQSAAAAAQVTGSPQATVEMEDMNCTVTVDTSVNDLRVRVTGSGAVTIDWVSFIELRVFTP